MVGYTPEPRIAKGLRNALQMNDLHFQLIQKLRAGFPNQVRVRRQRARAVIELNSSKISVYLCRQFLTKGGRKRWMFRIREKERQNLAFICPTSAGFAKILAFYVLPPVGNTVRRFKVLRVDDPWLLSRGRKLTTLAEFDSAVNQIVNCFGQNRLALVENRLPLTARRVLLGKLPALLRRCGANLFHCRFPFYLCLEHVDNLGAYCIPSETGFLIPSVSNNYLESAV
jgi:hypothetical protein